MRRSRLSGVYRRYFLYPRICHRLHGRTVDVGCGIGDFLQFRPNTIGVDINAHTVAYCKARGLDARLMEPDVLPFEDASFDSALMDNVLEHIAEPAALLRELRRVLRGRRSGADWGSGSTGLGLRFGPQGALRRGFAQRNAGILRLCTGRDFPYPALAIGVAEPAPASILRFRAVPEAALAAHVLSRSTRGNPGGIGARSRAPTTRGSATGRIRWPVHRRPASAPTRAQAAPGRSRFGAMD